MEEWGQKNCKRQNTRNSGLILPLIEMAQKQDMKNDNIDRQANMEREKYLVVPILDKELKANNDCGQRGN